MRCPCASCVARRVICTSNGNGRSRIYIGNRNNTVQLGGECLDNAGTQARLGAGNFLRHAHAVVHH